MNQAEADALMEQIVGLEAQINLGFAEDEAAYEAELRAEYERLCEEYATQWLGG